MWILWKMRLWKCEFCEKWDFENMNFVKNETLKMWILWKMRLWKLWILSKMRFSKCEFLEKLLIFASVCFKQKRPNSLASWQPHFTNYSLSGALVQKFNFCTYYGFLVRKAIREAKGSWDFTEQGGTFATNITQGKGWILSCIDCCSASALACWELRIRGRKKGIKLGWWCWKP